MENTLFCKLFDFLKEKNLTISSAESITGGAFAWNIVKFPNASKIFLGSIVSYSDESKTNILGIKKELLNVKGAISAETSLEMAKAVKDKFKSDIAISFTGDAGPNFSKKLGLVYITLIYKDFTFSEKLNLKGSRREIIENILKKAEDIIIKKV